MELDFESEKLAKQCADRRSRTRAFGADRAQRLEKRLTALIGATDLEELRNTPGRWHELRGDRAGQFAADLDHPYRLIFEPVLTAEERLTHAAGTIWSKITHVRIIEITDYHG